MTSTDDRTGAAPAPTGPLSKIDYSERIPNNVNLADDRRLQRALEGWQPKFLDWWKTLGPGAADQGRLPAHRDRGRPRRLGALRPRADGGLPLGHLPRRARPRPARSASASTRASRPGRRCPGEHRADLHAADRRPGRHRAGVASSSSGVLGNTAPSIYDLRNLFQVNVEEGRHLWAMVYLLHAYFGREGREEAEQLLKRNSGDLDSPAHPRRVQRGDHRLAVSSSCSPTSPTATASTSSAR